MKEIPPGPNPPEEVYVFIEIPKGSQNKYEFDKKLEVFKLDRALHSSLHYPADYGYIPSTLCGDGDPIDVLVLTTEPSFPGCLIEARPIGLIEMEDEKGIDNKILAVSINDPRFFHMKDIKDISQHTMKEIKHFFETYKALEPKKWVRVRGWFGNKKAKKTIAESIQFYKKQKGKITNF